MWGHLHIFFGIEENVRKRQERNNMKTCLLVLLLLLSASCLVFGQTSGKDFEGSWQGTLELPTPGNSTASIKARPFRLTKSPSLMMPSAGKSSRLRSSSKGP